MFMMLHLHVPTNHTTLGSFTAASQRLWNSLPLHLCDCELPLLEFRPLLKTHSFGWRSRRLVTYFRYSSLCKCTYLLTLSYLCVNTELGEQKWIARFTVPPCTSSNARDINLLKDDVDAAFQPFPSVNVQLIHLLHQLLHLLHRQLVEDAA